MRVTGLGKGRGWTVMKSQQRSQGQQGGALDARPCRVVSGGLETRPLPSPSSRQCCCQRGCYFKKAVSLKPKAVSGEGLRSGLQDLKPLNFEVMITLRGIWAAHKTVKPLMSSHNRGRKLCSTSNKQCVRNIVSFNKYWEWM